MPAPHHSIFLQAKCSSWCPTNSVKALKPTNSMWFPGFLFSPCSAEAQVRWVGKIIHLLIVSGERLCKKNCQAHNLNREDAMDHGRWKKLIKIEWWSGWRVGECFFWYRLTQVVVVVLFLPKIIYSIICRLYCTMQSIVYIYWDSSSIQITSVSGCSNL